MNDTVEAGAMSAGFPASLRQRVAAEVALTEFFRAQSRVPARSFFARLFGASVLSEESRFWFHESSGELTVGEALAQLGDDWVVLHAVPVDSREADIDHVVIGPAGIFTLSSNYHADQTVSVADRRFHVGGASVNHIRNTEFDIGRVERRLAAAAGTPVHVVGVIVVVHPRSLTVRDVPRDIAVITAAELVGWLRSRPTILDAGCVQRVAEVAERPATWVSSAVRLQDGERMHERFAAVQREVRHATIVHRLWLVAMAAGLLGMLALGAWGVVMQGVS